MLPGDPDPQPARLSWRTRLTLTVSTVYVPLGTPFLVGPLTECDHCVGTYLVFSPIIPGFIVGRLMPGDDHLVAAGLASLAALAIIYALMSRLAPRWRWGLWVITVLLSLLNALAVSHALRA